MWLRFLVSTHGEQGTVHLLERPVALARDETGGYVCVWRRYSPATAS
jgi:hypothetical protein